jgi:hypothetical protein
MTIRGSCYERQSLLEAKRGARGFTEPRKELTRSHSCQKFSFKEFRCKEMILLRNRA